MPVCALCESQGFDTIDGLFYCQNCGTQSQDVRVETADFDAVATTSNVAIKKGRKRHLKYARVKGKPWFTYEAFQWIIKLQVQFLINLGVDPELKDVVFQLWYRYLQKSDIAFTGCTQGLLPKSKTVSFERDSKMLGLTSSSSRSNGRKRKAEKKHDNYDDDDGLELCSHFSSEEFYEEDDPMKALDKSESDKEQDKKLGNEQESSAEGNANLKNHETSTDDSMTDSSDSEGSFGSLDVNTRRTQKVENGHVTPTTTLAFCYLGLLWLDEPVFISDLIRWVKEGNLPYFQASRLLPDHMKFSGSDSSHLCPVVVPNAVRVCMLAGRIAKMLQLPDFPEQKFSRYTARFIVDLHLPACVHGIVCKLIDKVRPRTLIQPSKSLKQQLAIQHFEMEAMAFIVVSLKLLYGIDNVTEREQESLAVPTDQNTHSPYEVVPLFTDWLNSYKKCEAARLERGVPWTEEQVKLVRDSATYSAFCRSDIFGSWAIPDLVNNETRFVNRPYYRCRNEESQEKYAQLFKSLMTGKQGEEFGSVKPAATGFPTSCYHTSEDSGSGCFDRMHLRGVPMQKLRESDSKYVYYPLSRNRTLYHESYRELLNILADHLQVPSHELQDRIRYIEDRLLVDQLRNSRYVRSEEEGQ